MMPLTTHPILLGLFLSASIPLVAQTLVTLSPIASPAAGQAGVTSVNVTGSNFPAGTILPGGVTVRLTPVAGGAAVQTFATAVTTVVGSTRRVTFVIPGTISVSSPTPYSVSISGITTTSVTFISSNTAALTINPAPRLLSIVPSSAQPGQTLTVTITSQFTNFTQGATQASFGAGIAVGGAAEGGFGPVTVSSPTQATARVVISSAAIQSPRTVTVRTGVQQAALQNGFSVGSAGASPTISDFNPKSAPIGTLVTISGTNLQPSAGTSAQISLPRLGGGTILAIAASSNAASLTFTIPSGAASGIFSVTINNSAVASSVPLTVTPSSNLSLTIAPGAADLIQGQSVGYAVSLGGNLTQLAALGVTGVPPGVTASFKPQSITSGQTSILTLTAAPGQSVGAVALTLTASATVDGILISQNVPAQLDIVSPTTSFLGRTVVDDPMETSISGVSVTMLGKDGSGGTTGCTGSGISDGAGNFILRNLPASCIGRQLVAFDGTTATSPAGKYAGVNLVYAFFSGQPTASPVLVHLPRIDNKETFLVQQNAPVDQTYAFTSIPGLSVTVYRGTTFTMPNGTQPNPFPLVAAQVPVDRLPDAKPPVPTMLLVFIVAFQPANAKASQPVAVTYPNVINTPPGSNMPLLTLDPTRGSMVPYGTATVSSNGTQVVPDLDPAFPGHRYGIVNFDWHGPMPMPTPPTKNQANPCPNGCPCPRINDPVDLSSGLFILNETDISLSGPRGTIAIVRTFRNAMNTGATTYGPFGYGTNHNFGYELDTTTPETADLINLVMPDGNQFPFSKQGSTWVNSSIPSMRGAVMSLVGPGTVDLRWKDGTTFRFVKITSGLFIREVLESITDRNGNKTEIRRAGFAILDIIDPVGRALHFNYNPQGYITQITDPIGRAVRYSYSGILPPVLRTVTHPDGSVTRYDYDNANPGNLTAITSPRGFIAVSNTYNSDGRVTQQRLPDGAIFQFSYKLLNPTAGIASPVQETTVTDARGNSTVYRFSPNGAWIGVTDPLGQSRSLDRDGNNQIVAIRGNASCSVCGSSGPGDQTLSYDANGNLLTQTDALGNRTSFTYELAFNNVASIRDPLGSVTTFSYDAHGNLLSLTDPNLKKTSFQYDPLGQLTHVTDPLNQKTSITYDSFGNVASLKDPLGNVTSFAYDAIGRLVNVQDALGRTTSTTYDNLNRITRQNDAKNNATQFAYDPVGNLLSVTDARGNPTVFTYDSMNRLATRRDPLGRTDTRQYDPNGNLTQFVDRRGQSSSFSYDVLNRLVGEAYQDGSNVSRSYDALSRLVRVDDTAGGVFTFSYDIAGRMTNSTTPFGAVRYQRDGLGRATLRQVIGQPAVMYSYDPAGNLTAAVMPQAAATFAYDARNQVSTISRLNGVVSTLTYDSSSRLSTLTHVKGSTLIDAEVYGYDAVGNRTSHFSSIAQALTTQAVATGSYNGNNEQSQFGSTTNIFDANGNLATASTTNGATTYTWDSRNRLKSIAGPGGQTTNFTYDFAGNLIQQVDTGPGLNLTQSFILDEITNVGYGNRSDGDQYSVLAGPSLDQHLAVVRAAGQAEYGVTNGINSTIVTTDEAGSIKGRFLYEAFGQTTALNSSFPFQYTGRVPATANLYYYRARFYNSQTGRFISEDPLFGIDGNLYAYAGNNPIQFGDPLGLLSPGQILKIITVTIPLLGNPGASAITTLLISNPAVAQQITTLFKDVNQLLGKITKSGPSPGNSTNQSNPAAPPQPPQPGGMPPPLPGYGLNFICPAIIVNPCALSAGQSLPFCSSI